MRHFSLCVAVVFFLSTTLFAQRSSSSSSSGGSSMSSGSGGGHSSGGGGSSGGSSGGSHSSGGSSWSGGHSSGGGHTSGGAHVSGDGSTSPGSNARSSTVHVSDTPAMINSRTHQAERSTTPRELRNQTQMMQPQKRSFSGFLRHPFRKPQPKIISKVPHPICLKGPCKVCANGQIAAQGGCGPATATAQPYGYCTSADVWNGNDCLFQTRFLNNCTAARLSMERQFQRIQVAESMRQNACLMGDNQSCMEAENALRSEQNLYRQLQAQYQQCQMNPGFGYTPGGRAFGRWNRSFGHMGFDSLRYDPFPMDALDFNLTY
jgi:hypothetical protein